MKMKSLRLIFLFLGVVGAVSQRAEATKDLGINPELLKTTEQLLRLAKPELEKASDKLTMEQKQILKKIAFNSDSDLQVRWRALVLATRLLGTEMRAEITTASQSNDWFMRSASMMAASEISIDEAAVLARKLLSDKALVVRSAAVDILGGTGEASDRQLLWNIIRDPINVRKGQSLWIRSQALQILAKNPKKKETSQFVALLNEGDLELQAIAIHALEKVSEIQFGSGQESIEEHRRRWLSWWEINGKAKSF